MGVHAAIHVDDLAGHIGALVAAEVHGRMGNVLGAAVAVDHDGAQEDVLQSLGHLALVLRSHDQARTDAVAADVLLAVLLSGVLGQNVHASLGTRVGS